LNWVNLFIEKLKIDKNYILWLFVYVPILATSVIIVGKNDTVKNILSEETPIVVETPVVYFVEPPEIVRAVYLTPNSGQNEKKIAWLIQLAKSSELNSVVIDVKDFSGFISYDSSVSDAETYKTEKPIIKNISALIKKLHENNIYVIARMTVFQDPALVLARPDWAVRNKYTGKPWQDRKGLSWIDPGCRECWGYYSAIAKDALAVGFDEINMDYIRFPSDGNMDAIVYPYWNQLDSKPRVLNQFFKFMRTELGDARMSADLFGFVTTRTEDFGVGQVIEDAFEHFDYISPMVYPSHYPPNFLGFASPAAHPYEVIYHVMKSARERLEKYKAETGNTRTHIRPWLQDFNLVGVSYTQAMVEAEIKATQDALGEHYNGFMLWNASNNYHEGVFYK
jgi:hypothetical protein